MDDVLAAWDAVDADVEEAADGDGEEENNYNQKAYFSHLYLYGTSYIKFSLLSYFNTKLDIGPFPTLLSKLKSIIYLNKIYF